MSNEIVLDSVDEARALMGSRDCNLRVLRERLNVKVVARNGRIRFDGEPGDVEKARSAMQSLLEIVRQGEWAGPEVLSRLIGGEPEGGGGNGSPGSISGRLPTPGGKDIAGQTPSGPLRVPSGYAPRTDGQKKYLDRIQKNDVVLAIGPAGTGKTFLAVLMAVGALKQGLVQKIILCRPAVEAGEKLGFLPGDFQAKINPYLRPLYDALNDILDFDTVKRYMDRELIEIVPLAFMRGRTLNKSFIILDEGQNTTIEQMKMFLTRMGEGSRIVVTGDTSQVDLPQGKKSGLIHARKILKNVDGIAIHVLSGSDIVRHPLVWKIVDAYDEKKSGGRK